MSPAQANEIMEFLKMELINNGFGDVLTAADTRLELGSPLPEEIYVELANSAEPEVRLQLFIGHCVEVLKDLSNTNYPVLVNEFREILTKGQPFNGFEFVGNGDDDEVYDLSNLPDYSKVIEMLLEIRIQITKGGENG